MIEGEKRGPFTLEELPDAGVMPDTYVWCKGMADWQQAGEVADICRYYRNHIFDMMHPSLAAPKDAPAQEAEAPGISEEEINPLDRRNVSGENYVEPPVDTDRAPSNMLPAAIIMTLLCFPPTGFVAIYFSFMSRKAWMMGSGAKDDGGMKQPGAGSAADKESYRKMAHDYARQAKMWTGITFFLGIILYGFITGRGLG